MRGAVHKFSYTSELYGTYLSTRDFLGLCISVRAVFLTFKVAESVSTTSPVP
jgi:hypothetical protein